VPRGERSRVQEPACGSAHADRAGTLSPVAWEPRAERGTLRAARGPHPRSAGTCWCGSAAARSVGRRERAAARRRPGRLGLATALVR
jgi:hypothetical protein